MSAVQTPAPTSPPDPRGAETAAPGGRQTMTERLTSRVRLDRRYLPVLGTFAVLALMLVVGGSRYENFLSARVISNLFINNSFLIVLAVGMTFVILTGGIDLSVGAVVALSTCVSAWMLTHGWPAVVAIPAAVLVGTVIGLAVGVMVHVFEIQPFIATLAAMFLARGLCYVISLQSIPITDESFVALAGWSQEFGDGWRITTAVIISLVVVAIAFYVLHYTQFGRTVYAIGGGEQSAMLMGLPVARTKVLVYVVSGTCAGIGGLLFAMFSRSGYSLTGVGMELDAIAAVVIGGTLLTGGAGTVAGTLAGVLLLRVIQNVINQIGTLSSHYQSVVSGAFLAVVVAVQAYLSRASR